tara:strand:- start:290 stop:718 length:429 start_codon:yes stop_codon:yes gene_type:complete
MKTINNINSRVLIIYGPNMNLLSLLSKEKKRRLTLDRLSKHIKAHSKLLTIKIFQTNDEIKATKMIQSHRNKIDGLILFPGPWQNCAYILNDIITILNLPFVTVSLGEKVNILRGIQNIEKNNLYEASTDALKVFEKKLQNK